MTPTDNRRHKTIQWPVAIVLAAVFSALGAAGADATDITVRNATAHVMEDPLNGRRIEVYLDIENSGTTRDRLYAVRSKLSRTTMLTVIHDADGGAHDDAGHPNMEMHMPTRVLEVAAGATMRLRHGNSHIMLMEPSEALSVGAVFPITLFFERAGRMSVDVTIVPMHMSH